MNKPSIPKGMRDFSPQEMVRRKYLFNTIEEGFRKFGYQPIETPSMETLDTLTGKYGEEGDRLIFKVLNSGDFLKKVDQTVLQEKNSRQAIAQLSEKALRYDLTVPFARYVVQHQNEIAFPFKRYQIQPVWRADRPQKGRFREFFQCDADVIGTDSLLCEVELIQLFDDVLFRLQIPEVKIHFNNRKLLSGLAEIAGVPEKLTTLTVALDKLDKIGQEKVVEEMRTNGIGEAAIEKLKPVFSLNGTNDEILEQLETLLGTSEEGRKGIEECREVFDKIKKQGLKGTKLALSPTLARGLDYYTGAIFEVTTDASDIGSICGGGRYDDLTGVFGMKGVSGVGISFGADRIYEVLKEKGLFPEQLTGTTKIMFVNFGGKGLEKSLELLGKLREQGVSGEVYPDEVKMKKQMKYANNKGIPFVAMIGEEELEKGGVVLKNMENGEQEEVSPDNIEEVLIN